MSDPAVIAVDWGTTNFRAYLLARDGAVLERREGHEGVMQVGAGAFPETLARYTGEWLARDAKLPVVMAGMVGSRNGWAEAPYVPCPASPRDLSAKRLGVLRADGGEATIVPGVSGMFDGAADVMRGEETKIAGLDLEDGLVCLPGTHPKWALIRGGRIEHFTTFMTGEVYSALCEHTILGRLARDPDDDAAFVRGLEEGKRQGGLLHRVFAARADVLLGTLEPTAVRPFLSGLLLADEVAGARQVYGRNDTVAVVAEGAAAARYKQALAREGYAATFTNPEDALIRGLLRLALPGRSR